jgi:hypothetical protein
MFVMFVNSVGGRCSRSGAGGCSLAVKLLRLLVGSRWCAAAMQAHGGVRSKLAFPDASSLVLWM